MNFALQATRCSVPRLAATAAPRAHLIGAAGAGMQALAEVLLAQGWRLSGSDIASDGAGWLVEAGVDVFAGHAAEHVPADSDLVVYSDAVAPANVERRRAVELGLTVRSYPEMLAELTAGRVTVAVAGTHGKSTTTALAAEIMTAAGLDPTVLAGGTPLGRRSGGRRGSGAFALVEACEYRRNFLKLSPRVAVVLGIEHDHFDCYDSPADVETAFVAFVQRVPDDGLVLAHAGCRAAMHIVRHLACRVVTFGVAREADWQARDLRCGRGRYAFRLLNHGRETATVTLRIPGRHNVLNALAAAAVAGELGVEPSALSAGLSRFAGLRRRLETVGQWRGAIVVDDYAHHPTEVTAALAAVREWFPGRRIWCVFQPHQVSRTRRLLDEFAAGLHNADRVAVTDVFRAREADRGSGDGTAADLAARVRKRGGRVLNVHRPNEVFEQVAARLVPGDVLLTLGAGDLRKICDAFRNGFGTYRAAG